MLDVSKLKIAVVGLGYVGLPLAVAFGRQQKVIGYDINEQRIAQLMDGVDITRETSETEIKSATNLSFTTDPQDIADCDCYIITVQTPITQSKHPDIRPLLDASATVGKLLTKNNIVIYESTVYPGCTEEDCVPVLEQHSSLKYNEDFYCGYSPERISPGNSKHKLTNTTKVTSGSTDEVADVVDRLYRQIVSTTHRAENIKVAEAAKVIENTQRDLNIALANELAIIFNKLGIDTESVIKAASTKWNFQPFRPGLVGGHCIGVDPYYLTHKAQQVGYDPKVILAGRSLNDSMGVYVAAQVAKLIARNKTDISPSRVLVLGFSFKEDCPDIRNTKVIDIVNELQEYGYNVDVFDPIVNQLEVMSEYGIFLTSDLHAGSYDAIVIAVAHEYFKKMGIERVRLLGKPKVSIYDVKSMFDKQDTNKRL